MSELAGLIQNLRGRKLESLRPGSPLLVKRVDVQAGQVSIIDAAGNLRTRPIRELEFLWDLLHRQPIVHVDSALKGSGSSRNQPETILANLPMVEWLSDGRRKSLALVAHPSHPFGTIRRMDDVAAALRLQPLPPTVEDVIVSDDIGATARLLERGFGKPQAPMPGVYEYQSDDRALLLVREDCADQLSPGSYTVLNGPTECNGQERHVQIGCHGFTASTVGAVTFLFRGAATSQSNALESDREL